MKACDVLDVDAFRRSPPPINTELEGSRPRDSGMSKVVVVETGIAEAVGTRYTRTQSGVDGSCDENDDCEAARVRKAESRR